MTQGKAGNTLLLVLTAAIWGFAFVAQRQGNEHLDPLLFNGLRFALGALSIAVLRAWHRKNEPLNTNDVSAPRFRDILLLGTLLFLAASFQQIGLLWTTAGNAGFITGLYIVFIPVIGFWRGQKVARAMLMALVLAVIGLWLINRGADMRANLGNGLVLISAVLFAFHVQMIDKLTSQHPSLDLALGQFAVCAAFSLSGSAVFNVLWMPGYLTSVQLARDIASAFLPILYGGLMSVGIAYTLQIHAQKKVAPLPAGIILCLEAVFAMLGGSLLLGEAVTLSGLGGAALLFCAMLVSLVSAR